MDFSNQNYLNSTESIYTLNDVKRRLELSNSSFERLLNRYDSSTSSSIDLKKETIRKNISTQRRLIERIEFLKRNIQIETDNLNSKIRREKELKKEE